MDEIAANLITLILGGFAVLSATLLVVLLDKLWFRVAFVVMGFAGICLLVLYLDDRGLTLDAESEKTADRVKIEDHSPRSTTSAVAEQHRSPSTTVDARYQSDCRSGWFEASNVATRIKLSCLRENESFEITCPENHPKANGICLVRWYENGEPAGELVTSYKDGEQVADIPTYGYIKIKYPYYTETLSRAEWEDLSNSRKKSVSFEAWRERFTAKKGGAHYRYPQTLDDVQSEK